MPKKPDAPDPAGWEQDADEGARPTFLERTPRGGLKRPPDSLDGLASQVLAPETAQGNAAKQLVHLFHADLRAGRTQIPSLSGGATPPPAPNLQKRSKPDPRAPLVAAVRGEPGLALKAMRALREGPARLSAGSLDLEEIARRLPLDSLRTLVAEAASGASGEAPAENPWQPLLTKLWRHTITAARAAESIAQTRLRREPGAIYTITLLHNVGELAIVELFRALEQQPPSDGIATGAMAKELDRFHEAVGGLILKRLKVPQILTSVAEHHHPPLTHAAGGPPARYAALVSGCSAAADLAGLAYKEAGHDREAELAICADVLGLPPEVLIEATKAAQEGWSA